MVMSEEHQQTNERLTDVPSPMNIAFKRLVIDPRIATYLLPLPQHTPSRRHKQLLVRTAWGTLGSQEQRVVAKCAKRASNFNVPNHYAPPSFRSSNRWTIRADQYSGPTT